MSWSKFDVKAYLGNLVKSAARTISPSKTRSPKEKPPNSDRPFSGDAYYTVSIKLFHKNDCGPALVTGSAFLPTPATAPIRGFVCKAARLLLGQTQEWLSHASKVSRKTLNDFEIGDIEPKIALNNRMRAALEEAGASFVSGEHVVGVVVYTKPAAKAAQGKTA